MDIRLPTAAREPEWFCPETFSKEVLNHTFRKFGIIPPATKLSLFKLPVDFRRAVETVGNAVFTIQVKIHDDIWPLFGRGISVIDDALVWRNPDNRIIDFMRQGYLREDIFNTVFSVLAIIGELSLFLQEFMIPTPLDLHHRPFCRIYDHSLRGELLAEGGFERLLHEADNRYMRPDLYAENSRVHYPHGLVPKSVSEALKLGFNVAPPDINISLSILQEIYLEHNVVP